jgi:hypothetical protein
MNSRSKVSKALLGLTVAAMIVRAIGGELVFELSEVASREWRSNGGKQFRFIKLERPVVGRFALAVAHYGPTPTETMCIDFYEFRGVNNRTNAHLRLLEHDMRDGKVIKMDYQTNATDVLISVTRERTNPDGNIIRNQYGYRLNPDKTLSRTTEDLEFLISR